jgi:hypothetical protein
MSETTRAEWRYAIGQRVSWAGDRSVVTITSRRWVERQIFAPYAEYQVQWPQVRGTSWVVEADLDAVDAGEGEA